MALGVAPRAANEFKPIVPNHAERPIITLRSPDLGTMSDRA